MPVATQAKPKASSEESLNEESLNEESLNEESLNEESLNEESSAGRYGAETAHLTSGRKTAAGKADALRAAGFEPVFRYQITSTDEEHYFTGEEEVARLMERDHAEGEHASLIRLVTDEAVNPLVACYDPDDGERGVAVNFLPEPWSGDTEQVTSGSETVAGKIEALRAAGIEPTFKVYNCFSESEWYVEGEEALRSHIKSEHGDGTDPLVVRLLTDEAENPVILAFDPDDGDVLGELLAEAFGGRGEAKQKS